LFIVISKISLCKDSIYKIQINQPTRHKTVASLLLEVYVWLNMFRVPPRPSSRAYNCINSLRIYRWSVVVAALLVVVWPTGICCIWLVDLFELYGDAGLGNVNSIYKNCQIRCTSGSNNFNEQKKKAEI
jgi:hypothetical protein